MFGEKRAFVAGFQTSVPHAAVNLNHRRQISRAGTGRNVAIDRDAVDRKFSTEVVRFSNFQLLFVLDPSEKFQGYLGLLYSSFPLQIAIVRDNDTLVGLVEFR